MFGEEQPDIVIVVEGGAITNVVTKGNSIRYRIIDIDVRKENPDKGVEDYEPDAVNIDPDEYTKEILKEVDK